MSPLPDDPKNPVLPQRRVAYSPVEFKPEQFSSIIRTYNDDYCGSEVCNNRLTNWAALKHFYLWGEKEEFTVYLALCCATKKGHDGKPWIVTGRSNVEYAQERPEPNGINRCCSPHISGDQLCIIPCNL
jgi:hypothetical protein